MLVRWWFKVVGPGVVQARILSAIAATLAVPALYWLGTLLFDRRTAAIASGLLAASQLGIVYGQEARAYSLLLLLAIVLCALFVRAFRSGSPRDFAFLVVAASVMMYVHYYAAWAVAALLVFAVIFRRQSAIPAVWWAAGLAVMLVAYMPWLTSGVIASAIGNPRGAGLPSRRSAARCGYPRSRERLSLRSPLARVGQDLVEAGTADLYSGARGTGSRLPGRPVLVLHGHGRPALHATAGLIRPPCEPPSPPTTSSPAGRSRRASDQRPLETRP